MSKTCELKREIVAHDKEILQHRENIEKARKKMRNLLQNMKHEKDRDACYFEVWDWQEWYTCKNCEHKWMDDCIEKRKRDLIEFFYV